MERAIMGDLEPSQKKLLDIALGVAFLAGVLVGMLWPQLLGLTLLFPLMALCFFRGVKAGWIVLPALLIHAWYWPGPVPNLVFGLCAILGIVFASVTTAKYRQTRRHERRLESDLDLARDLQSSLQPPSQIRLGPLELGLHLQTSRELGGDFVCLGQPGDGRFSILLGDVMGKGTRAALTAALLNGLYAELVELGLSPGPLMTQLNLRLTERFGSASCLATAVCLELDVGRELWLCSRAGHPPPLLTRAQGEDESLQPEGLLLGVDSHERYLETTTPHRTGDQVLIVSDGLVLSDLPAEAALGDLLRTRARHELRATLTQVVKRLKLALPEPVEDDETALLVRSL